MFIDRQTVLQYEYSYCLPRYLCNYYRLVPEITQPASGYPIMHKDFIDHICYTTKPYHAIITGILFNI